MPIATLRTGRTPQEWKQLLYDIPATNDDGLWTHAKFGYTVLFKRTGEREGVSL